MSNTDRSEHGVKQLSKKKHINLYFVSIKVCQNCKSKREGDYVTVDGFYRRFFCTPCIELKGLSAFISKDSFISTSANKFKSLLHKSQK